MPHLTSRIELTAIALAVALTGMRAEAQASKVLTVPRSDTARPAPPKPTTPTTAQGKSTAAPPPAAAAPAPAPIAQGAVLDSIREAVFRNLLERDRAGFGTLAGAFCLGLSGVDYKKAGGSTDRADPPEWLVRRVATSRTPARRASTCLFQPNAATRSVPGRSLLYNVGTIDMSDNGRAEVAAAYNYDGYSAGGYTFSVERVDTAWVVKQWRLEWTATKP